MEFLIIDAKDIRKTSNIVVFTLKQGDRILQENLVRTAEQYKLDLVNSGFDEDENVHPSKLIGAKLTANIEEHQAGTTYKLDENSSLVQRGVLEATDVARNIDGKLTKVSLAKGEKALVGDITVRRKAATRIKEGFVTFIVNDALMRTIAFSNLKQLRKMIVEDMNSAFHSAVESAPVVETPKQPAPVAVVTDDELEKLFGPQSTEESTEESEEEELTPEIADALAEAEAAKLAAKSAKIK